MTVVLVRVPAADALAAAGRERIAALHATGRVDAVVLGQDAGGADPSTAAAFLSARHPDLDLVLEASFEGDFVYNLARRVGSLQALAGRAAGVLLPPGDVETVVSLQLLWQSWPRDSIVGDRESGRFVDASRIRRVERGGAHPVAGPLQVPVDQDDLPVVLQRVDPERPDGARAADAVVVAAGSAGSVADRPVIVATDAGGLRSVLAARPAGVLIEGPVDADALAADVPPRATGGLRARLGLGAPRVSLETPPLELAREGW